MKDTSSIRKRKDETETQFRRTQSLWFQRQTFPGSGAWARTHDQEILRIRAAYVNGSTRGFKTCPWCSSKGNDYILLEAGEKLYCGTCGGNFD